VKFKIHFTIGDYEDSFVVTGDTIEEIRNASNSYFESRGLDANGCNAWSEEIK
jgi:hypothetical protein